MILTADYLLTVDRNTVIENGAAAIRGDRILMVGTRAEVCAAYPDEEVKEYVSIIKHNSDLLLKLVNDTVSVSLLQAEQLPLVWESVEIIQYCKELLAGYSGKLAPGVKLEFKSSSDFYMFRTDKAQLKQVLDNLLSNAVKFTEKGSVTLVCEIDEQSGNVRFIVEDTGCGIPKEKQDKIFESFEKADSFVQGMGLGLTICKLVAERLKGTIVLDTAYEKGTRMIFTHPL